MRKSVTKAGMAAFLGLLLLTLGLIGFGVEERTAAGAPLPAAPPTYRLTDLGVINQGEFGQRISRPAGINQSGQVAGWSYSVFKQHATRFTNGLVEDLGTIPGGLSSTGVGINDAGHVVGDSEYSPDGGSIRHAALFSDGTAIDLGTLPQSGNYSRANDINNVGQVVGHSGPSLSTSNTRAFIWDADSGMRDMGTLGGGFAKAFSINDAGQATGTSQLSTSFHAFIWDQANGMRDLGTIGGSSSYGTFINSLGHVVGSSTIAEDNRQHAFLWDGSMHDLGTLGGNDFFSDRSFATGLNDWDHVVGSTFLPYAGGALHQVPFVYMNGQMYDLTTLVDASGADYRLYVATGINNAGQVAVEAIQLSTNETHAVLLTPNQAASPTPTPAAGVTVSGQVTAPGGQAIRNAIVTVTSAHGEQKTAVTSSFGFYSVQGVRPGEVHTIRVSSKRYRFAAVQVQAMNDTSNINFFGTL